MLINPAAQRPAESIPSNVGGPSGEEKVSNSASPGDSPALSTANLRLASDDAGSAELDGAAALAAVDFARRSIELDPSAAISVQANARPENVLELLQESVLGS